MNKSLLKLIWHEKTNKGTVWDNANKCTYFVFVLFERFYFQFCSDNI